MDAASGLLSNKGKRCNLRHLVMFEFVSLLGETQKNKIKRISHMHPYRANNIQNKDVKICVPI